MTGAAGAALGAQLDRLRGELAGLREVTAGDGLPGDPVVVSAAKYRFVTAVAAAVGVCHAVIAAEGLRSSSDATDAFRVLAEQERLPPALADRLLDAVALRDAFVRGAGGDDAVARLRAGSADLEGFLAAVAGGGQPPG